MGFVSGRSILGGPREKKREFEKFLVRKRPSEDRKDITILNALFQYYNSPKKENLVQKGMQKYHAVRKRLTKELIRFIILKNAFIILIELSIVSQFDYELIFKMICRWSLSHISRALEEQTQPYNFISWRLRSLY